MKSRFLVFPCATLLSIACALGADSPQSVPAGYLEAARQAKRLFDRGNYDEAERIYESILSGAPKNLYVLSNLGVVRFRRGKLKLAVKVFRQATVVAPNDAFSHCTLGIVYCSLNCYDDAIKSLRRAIALDPKSATAHNYLGIAYSQKGMPRKAAREWDIARELDPAYKEPDKLPEEIPTRFRTNAA